jgi:tetratricopeptide (TPR) repeat protein
VGVAHDRFKFIRAPVAEVYDLAQDPGERSNVHAADAARAASLSALVDRLVVEHPLASEGATSLSPSSEDREKLARLGYVGMQAKASAAPGANLPDPKSKLESLHRRLHAIELLRKGQPATALPILKTLLDEEPDNQAYLNNYGVALSHVGRTAEAVRYLELAAEKGDLTASNCATLGDLYLQLGQPEAAEKQFRHALALQPKHLFALMQLGEILEKQDRAAEARQCYEQLLSLWDGDAATRDNVARRIARLTSK